MYSLVSFILQSDDELQYSVCDYVFFPLSEILTVERASFHFKGECC